MPVSITETTPTQVMRRKSGPNRWMTCLAGIIVSLIVLFALWSWAIGLFSSRNYPDPIIDVNVTAIRQADRNHSGKRDASRNRYRDAIYSRLIGSPERHHHRRLQLSLKP